jgi:hypothetical protein
MSSSAMLLEPTVSPVLECRANKRLGFIPLPCSAFAELMAERSNTLGKILEK